MIQDYLLDIGKIVEGAANGDHQKVVAYGDRLSKKLADNGERAAAKRIKEIIGKSKATKVATARSDQPQYRMPVDSESQIAVADEEHATKGAVQLFLSEDADKAVKQFLSFYRAADRLIANGVGVSASMLLYGPPGCGKTQLARYIAADLDLPLLTARSDGLISSYLGSTAKNLRALFEHAMSRPCVLFLDEFDALAKMRDDDRELGELKRVVISLLQNIDAMSKDHVLIAATNHDHLLDTAIWRRFAYKLRLSEPTQAVREAMLRGYFGAFATDELIEVGAAVGNGLSGAQLRDIAEDSVREAILDNRDFVHLKSVIDRAFAAAGRNMQGTLAEQLRLVRNVDPKKFTQPRLAKIFNCTQGYVSQLLREDRENAA